MRSLVVFAISAAAELKVADVIGDNICPIDELAYVTQTDANSLHRLLRALSGEGIFIEEEGGYRNSILSNTLRRDIPDSQYAWAQFMASPQVNRCFERLSWSLATGLPIFDEIHGCSFFESLRRDPAAANRFASAMTSMSASSLADALDAYDFSQAGCVVDVGGGYGTFLRGILAAHPLTSGILFKRPEIPANAARDETGADERLMLASGDYFDSVPRLGDTYILRHVLRDWPDDKAIGILRNCRKAMRPDGCVLIFEHVLRPANEHDYAKFLDLMLLAYATGRERSIGEFGRLVDQAGLRIKRVIPAGGVHTIIEARI
ncbi:methyltransferase [Acerihabitans arboris]|uniref:Methyltransferase n=1 Tax=Acerihabitans arboris TaxID=2691583 RepID=A0A845SRV9_9GAMM|nr:methyltransferase [Acerihabitans arboris]NDL63855.1 methyltransferase [Acerihabitans arboris]